jgi:hypothetical protein
MGLKRKVGFGIIAIGTLSIPLCLGTSAFYDGRKTELMQTPVMQRLSELEEGLDSAESNLLSSLQNSESIDAEALKSYNQILADYNTLRESEEVQETQKRLDELNAQGSSYIALSFMGMGAIIGGLALASSEQNRRKD